MEKTAKHEATRLCEIIYVKHKDANGWKWRLIDGDGRAKPSKETFELFYECVSDARSKGYQPNIKCL